MAAAVLKPVGLEQPHPLIRWPMTDARKLADPNKFLEAFANELRGADIDVSRITTGVPILHPQILLSSDFVSAGGIAAQSLGHFSLKGVGAEQEIFAPFAMTASQRTAR